MKYFITNGDYVGNAMVWWREKGRGYTPDVEDAGQFEEKEAKEICSNKSRFEKAFEVSYILSKTTTIVDMQRISSKKALV